MSRGQRGRRSEGPTWDCTRLLGEGVVLEGVACRGRRERVGEGSAADGVLGWVGTKRCPLLARGTAGPGWSLEGTRRS